MGFSTVTLSGSRGGHYSVHSGCCRRSWGERLPGTPLPPGPLHWHRDCQARAAGRMQTTALRDQLTPPAGALGTTGPPLSPQPHTSRAPPPSTPKHAHGGWSGGSHISQVLGSLAGATLGSPLGDFLSPNPPPRHLPSSTSPPAAGSTTALDAQALAPLASPPSRGLGAPARPRPPRGSSTASPSREILVSRT